MKPQDLIRAAAGILNTVGWTHGTDQRGQAIHARNARGDAIPLFRGDNSGQDRSKVNPDAVAFSIYGAMVKAMSQAKTQVANPGLMWQTMYRVAATSGAPRPGGINHVHPLFQINELEGQTLDGVLAYLERAAVEIEAAPDPDAIEPSTASKALSGLNSFAPGMDTGLVAPKTEVNIPNRVYALNADGPREIQAPLVASEDSFPADSVTFSAVGDAGVPDEGGKPEPEASPVAFDHDDDQTPIGDM